MVDVRLMLADAHLAGSKNLLQIRQQPQPAQCLRHVGSGTGGSRRHGDVPLRQKRKQRSCPRLGRHFVKIVVRQHPGDTVPDLRLALRQGIVGFQIRRPLLHAHGEQDGVQPRFRRDPLPPEIPGAQIVPDAHGVQQNPVQIKNRAPDHPFSISDVALFRSAAAA